MTEGTHLDEDLQSNFWLKFFFVMFIIIMGIGAVVGGSVALQKMCPDKAPAASEPAPHGH